VNDDLAFKIARAKRELHRWRNQSPTDAYSDGYIAFCVKRASKKISRLQREEEQMRRTAIDEEPVTNSPEFPWRAQKRLTFGDRTYNRGDVVDDAIVNASANVVALINGGWIRRTSAPVSAPIPAAIKNLAANPAQVKPRDHWGECRALLKSIAAKRQITMREAGNTRDALESVGMAIRSRVGNTFNRPVDKLYDELFAE
jgi:hypothetical protein